MVLTHRVIDLHEQLDRVDAIPWDDVAATPIASIRDLSLAAMSYTGDDFKRLVIHPLTLIAAVKTKEFNDRAEFYCIHLPDEETTHRIRYIDVASRAFGLMTEKIVELDGIAPEFVTLSYLSPEANRVERVARLRVL